jgi:hypothetical protein
MKAANAKSQSWRGGGELVAKKSQKASIGVGTAPPRDPGRSATSSHLSVIRNADPADLQCASVERPEKLSVRAENVLKILAVELTGEDPARGRWVPSDLLLQRLTYKHLATARNCGPQTMAEIVSWAQTRGTIIRRSFHAGKSLSAMWQHLLAKCATGEIPTAEIAEALENSTRRRNTRVPVALQKILLQLIRSSNG